MLACKEDVLSSNGWTPIPNWLLEANHVDPVPFKILIFIARRLYGWSSPKDEFSIRFLATGTGIPRSTVHRHLKMLINSGLILTVGKGKRGVSRLAIAPDRPITNSQMSRLVDDTVPANGGQSPFQQVGQNKENDLNKPVQIQKQASRLSQDSMNREDLFVVLKRSLSGQTLTRVQDAFLEFRNNRYYFSDTLNPTVRFMLSRIDGYHFEFIKKVS